MNAKILFLIVCLAIPAKDYAQTMVSRNIPVQAGQSIVMEFDYPRLIRVSTWEKSELAIRASVRINDGEHDDAFLLHESKEGSVVRVTSEIRDLKDLPPRVTVHRDGQKIVFRNKEELEKYQAQYGRGYSYISHGPDIEIEVEVLVPRNTQTRVRSDYGMVEVKNFAGPLTVDATYGGVDASLTERMVGELAAETNFGNIYTDLDIDFRDGGRTDDFYTAVSARPGNGPAYRFESKFGSVYLRKERN